MKSIPYHEYLQWARTEKGTYIPCFSSFSLDTRPPSRPLLMVGGVHGDEPEGVALAEATLNWLKTETTENPWILIPRINPDGLEAQTRTNAQGVDLNRNFPTTNWNSEHSKPRYFPGPLAGSEKETQSLVELIQKQNPIMIIHCHSWKPCVVYTGEKGRQAAELLAQSSGYDASETIGYATPGSLGDYGGIDMKIPTICIEAQEGAPLNSVWPRFEDALKKIFQSRSLPDIIER